MAVDDASQVVEDSSTLGKRKRSSDKLVSDPPQGLPFRQFSETPLDTGISDHGSPLSATKRIRLPSRHGFNLPQEIYSKQTVILSSIETRLPAEILQYICTFLDPRSLARLLCVSGLFQALLDPRKPLPPGSEKARPLFLRPQDSVWGYSRRRWLSQMPRPMSDVTEFDSLRLVFGRRCQFCGKLPNKLATQSGPPWTRGPGSESVRVIWPFKIRSCADCLTPRIMKDIDVFISSASILVSGLPFALFTSSLHFLPAAVARQVSIPHDLSISKYFFREQVQNLEFAASEARSFGPAALEEWFKGLESTREQAMNDAARFEQWEYTGGPDSAFTSLLLLPQQIQELPRAEANDAFLANPRRGSPAISATLSHAPSVKTAPPSIAQGSLPYMPLYPIGPAPGQTFSEGFRPPASDSASVTSQKGRTKPPKSIRDLAKSRAEKEHDIQKRCMQLNPPIYPEILEELPAFSAALLISRPLDDQAWEILKERLLSQLADLHVQANAKDEIVEAPVPFEYNPQKWNSEMLSVNAKKPIREKICGYAEEYIRHKWAFGSFVNYATAPQFAADVLQHVRTRFYQIQSEERRVLDGSGMQTHEDDDFLTLEHMKWIFEQTIKPRTDSIRKELFLCNLCNLNAAKYFAFDSVIQHYASKHTSELSRGQQTVYWKSRWPEQPIFNPHPDQASSSQASVFLSENVPLERFPLPPGSEHTMKVPSAGRQSPGTMSQISSHIGTIPVQSSSASTATVRPLPPGVGMYHAHRDDLTTFLLQAWREIQQIDDITVTLKIHLLIHRAIRLFKQVYANEPHFSLFADCIDNKIDLRFLREQSDLRCRACVLSENQNYPPKPSALRTFRLTDLLHHFRDEHAEPHQPGAKLSWKYHMVELPPLGSLREIGERLNLTEDMRMLLKDALVAAMSKGDPLHAPAKTPISTTASDIAEDVHEPIRSIATELPNPRYSVTYGPGSLDHYHRYDSQHGFQYVRDIGFGEDRYVRGPVYEASQAQSLSSIRNFPHTYTESSISYQQAPYPMEHSHIGIDRNSDQEYAHYSKSRKVMYHSQYPEIRSALPPSRTTTIIGDTAALSEPVASPAQERPSSTATQLATDFLTALDNVADLEMKQGSGTPSMTAHLSPPQSHSRLSISQQPQSEIEEQSKSQAIAGEAKTHTTGVSGHWEQQLSDVFREYPPRRQTTSLQRGSFSPEAVAAPGGRFIEYDQRGLPIEHRGIRYVELSPQRARPQPSFDREGHLVELAHPDLIQEGEFRYREGPVYASRYPDEVRYSNHGEGRVEYVRVPPSAYYEATGPYYVKRPAVREYIELDDRYERVPSHIERVHERQRPIYREIPPSLSNPESTTQSHERAYEKYSADFEARQARR